LAGKREAKRASKEKMVMHEGCEKVSAVGVGYPVPILLCARLRGCMKHLLWWPSTLCLHVRGDRGDRGRSGGEKAAAESG
jgi:hypothetical protein